MRQTVIDKHISLLLSLDLTNSFDRVSHVLLVHKLLRQFDFSQSAAAMIESYLSAHLQFVLVDAINSEPLKVRSGVSQGSTISPLSSTLYMNDFFNMSNLASCDGFAFPDDLHILFARSVDNMEGYQSNINYYLGCISRWMGLNEFEVNWAKAYAIVCRWCQC